MVDITEWERLRSGHDGLVYDVVSRLGECRQRDSSSRRAVDDSRRRLVACGVAMTPQSHGAS